MDDWSHDMTRLWHRATGATGWGIWTHEDTFTCPVSVPLPFRTVPSRQNPETTMVVSIPGWHAVRTLTGRLVALTPSVDVAAIVANVPELMEPTLRPASAPGTLGVPTGAQAHEHGWTAGHAVGEAEAFDEANAIVNDLLNALGQIPDPTVQGAVAQARKDWASATADWPDHEGEADHDHPNEEPGDPRPVC